MTSSRLIRGGDAPAVAWKAPEVPNPGGPGSFRRTGDSDLAAVQQRAWDKGFAEGRAAGIEAGTRELAGAGLDAGGAALGEALVPGALLHGRQVAVARPAEAARAARVGHLGRLPGNCRGVAAADEPRRSHRHRRRG